MNSQRQRYPRQSREYYEDEQYYEQQYRQPQQYRQQRPVQQRQPQQTQQRQPQPVPTVTPYSQTKPSFFEKALATIVSVTSGGLGKTKVERSAVRCANVKYEDCKKLESYDKYLLKAGEDFE